MTVIASASTRFAGWVWATVRPVVSQVQSVSNPPNGQSDSGDEPPATARPTTSQPT